MKKKINLFLICSILSLAGFSQVNTSFTGGMNLWSINHDYEYVSHPMTPGYQLGFLVDFPIQNQSFSSGLEFRLASKTERYTDKTAGTNAIASIYENVIYNSYTSKPHVQVGIPLLYNFSLFQLSNSLGVEYNLFQYNTGLSNLSKTHHTLGFRLETGIQISKHLALKAGFYQSVFSTMELDVIVPELNLNSSLKSSAQRLYLTLVYSIKPKKTPELFKVKYRSKTD